LTLDAGTGLLVRKLARQCTAVTGIDRGRAHSRPCAREHASSLANVTYVEGDFLKHPFDEASFDFACANTALHHMDFGDALARMARILRPGGAPRRRRPSRTTAPPLTGSSAVRASRPTSTTSAPKARGNSGAPIMDPDMSWSQVRRIAAPAASRRPLPAATSCGATRSGGPSPPRTARRDAGSV